jgi:hypothetical protein
MMRPQVCKNRTTLGQSALTLKDRSAGHRAREGTGESHTINLGQSLQDSDVVGLQFDLYLTVYSLGEYSMK